MFQYVEALKIKDIVYILQNLLERSCFQFYSDKLRQNSILVYYLLILQTLTTQRKLRCQGPVPR